MSTNCINCGTNRRTGTDLLCNECRRNKPPTGSCLVCGQLRKFKAWSSFDEGCGLCEDCYDGPEKLAEAKKNAKELIDQLTKERDEARKNEAICHCGEKLSAHQVYSSCTTFVEMKELCPYAETIIELREALREALGAFALTQNPSSYGADHWSNKAIALLTPTTP